MNHKKILSVLVLVLVSAVLRYSVSSVCGIKKNVRTWFQGTPFYSYLISFSGSLITCGAECWGSNLNAPKNWPLMFDNLLSLIPQYSRAVVLYLILVFEILGKGRVYKKKKVWPPSISHCPYNYNVRKKYIWQRFGAILHFIVDVCMEKHHIWGIPRVA